MNYLDARDFFQHIFSAHHNEWDCYQGRELSFLFGWIDAQAIRYSARAGIPHLYSLTHFAALTALAVMLWRLLPRLLGPITSKQSGMVVALLLSTPVASLSGYYYRPAKILAALLLVVLLGQILSALRSLPAGTLKPLTLVVISGTLLGMTDRLGIFALLLTGGMVLLARPADRSSIRVIAAIAAALALNAVWTVLIGPALAGMADGYRPDTGDEVIRLRHTFLNPQHYRAAVSIWLGHLGYYFGNTGLYGTAAIAALATVVTFKARAWRQGMMIAGGAAASLLLYVAMYARLESLVWPASRRVYYWLPLFVMVAIGVAIIVSRSSRAGSRFNRLASPLLALLVTVNLFSLPAHRTAIRSQEHRQWILEGPEVRRCIASFPRPVSAFAVSPEYAQVCSAVRTAAWGNAGDGGPAPRVAPNPVLSCRRVAKPAFRSSSYDAFAPLRDRRLPRPGRA